jgi:hypothetical protein
VTVAKGKAKPKLAPSGDRRAELEWLRGVLRESIDDATDPFARSQLAAQFRAVVNDLAALAPATVEVSVRDELKQRRADRIAARVAAAASGTGATGSG